jgi:hypothetical protein
VSIYGFRICLFCVDVIDIVNFDIYLLSRVLVLLG